MLKRTKKIRQYTALLKAKRRKQLEGRHHPILKYAVEEPAQVKHEEPPRLLIEEERESACWNDSDDEQQIELPASSRLKKFGQGTSSLRQMENHMASTYRRQFQKQSNWAQEGSTIVEKDVNDFLNEEVFYGSHHPTKKVIRFQARTHEKHDSVVSGLDWHNNVMFSCGLDHKTKVWSYHHSETNPELKLRKEKDLYFSDLPLSSCMYRNGQLILGTLRRNLVLLDCEKWQPTFITSNFLKEHKTYQNMRASRNSHLVAVFDGTRASILDRNNVYAGNLLANEEINDLTFHENNEHLVSAVTNDSIYEWDLRRFQVSRLEKKYLGFTSIAASNHSLSVGSRLGTVYIYDAANLKGPALENNNLLTHVTRLKQNHSGDLLVALSKWKTNAMRVLDCSSGRSVGEWPSARTKVGMAMEAGFNRWDNLGVGSSHGYVSIFAFEEETV